MERGGCDNVYPIKSFVINVFGNPITEKLFCGFLSILGKKSVTGTEGGSRLLFQTQVHPLVLLSLDSNLTNHNNPWLFHSLKLFPCLYHKIESDPE